MKILEFDDNIIALIKEIGEDSESDLPLLIEKETGKKAFPIHRLDKNVGGVMVYALNKNYAAILSKQIQEGLFVKEYVAMVHGSLENKEGILEDFLFKDSRTNKVFVVKKERKGVKKAKLSYKVLKENNDYSIVHIKLYTGRTHQIRIQFANIKHSLYGDHKYGAKDEYKAPMLYSCKISFKYKKIDKVIESYPEWI